MNDVNRHAALHRPPTWGLVLAFALVYLAWGTTYFAIKVGVEVFPPALFGGVRFFLAGLILFLFLAWRGEQLRVARREFFWMAVVGILLFVGGNGLIMVGEKTVDSGVASVLVATTPLWLAFFEALWPWGERLNMRGWAGLLAGLGGVLLLLTPKLTDPASFWRDVGPVWILSSALCWSLGSFLLRRRRAAVTPLVSATYQMLIGGGCLAVVGLVLGEASTLTTAHFTEHPTAILAFFHLLTVGALVGFVAYNWLLHHVSAAMAGTYAYVNPAVAILVGWLLGGEIITGWIIGGMVVILVGVALVRGGMKSKQPRSA
jgi:drug/metabolite transporter (DMT)-like permease